MQKFSKNSKNVKKSYKKINQSQILYRIVFKLGAAGFCKNFYTNLLQKNAFLHSLAFSFFRKSHFCIKKQPPRRIVDSSVNFSFLCV